MIGRGREKSRTIKAFCWVWGLGLLALLFCCRQIPEALPATQDGVVLGADTRATEGPIVADKNCEKIHYLAPNIFCCGAGTSADCENVTEMMSSNLTLHRLNTGRECRVSTAVTMLAQYLFRYQGHISAALVVGGVDGEHAEQEWKTRTKARRSMRADN